MRIILSLFLGFLIGFSLSPSSAMGVSKAKALKVKAMTLLQKMKNDSDTPDDRKKLLRIIARMVLE